jgi:hypothetical protein
MKKTLVIGDIHLRHKIVKQILDKWSGPIIQVGDWFDNFGEKEKDTIATAELFKEFVHRPDTITLMGNHDIQYRIKDKNGLYCSGYEPWKYNVINDIVKEEDWCKLKYFHHEQNYWFSHAGVSSYWFQHPVHGATAKVIEEQISKAEKSLHSRLYSQIGCLYAADFTRGGTFPSGGILWNDWSNIEHHEGIIEIVGHTPSKKIQFKKHDDKSLSINVDSSLKELLIIDEIDSFEIVKTENFYA